MAKWRVDLIGKKLQHVGTVEARTEQEAIDEVAKLFRIAPALRDKLTAMKVKA